MIGGWLYHVLGIGGSGPWYGFWSGFGSDLGEVTVIAGLVALYRKHNCHEARCWRIGRHPVEGTPYVTCRKHHPALPDKAARGDIARAYAARKTAAQKITPVATREQT